MIPANASELSTRLSADQTVGHLFAEPVQFVVVPQFGKPSNEYMAIVEILRAVPSREELVMVLRRTVELLKELNALDNLVGVEILVCAFLEGRVQRLLRYAQSSGVAPSVDRDFREQTSEESSLILYPPLRPFLERPP